MGSSILLSFLAVLIAIVIAYADYDNKPRTKGIIIVFSVIIFIVQTCTSVQGALESERKLTDEKLKTAEEKRKTDQERIDRIRDSTRYITDSIRNNNDRLKDSLQYVYVDSIKSLQLKIYKNQLNADSSISLIQNKTTAIIRNINSFYAGLAEKNKALAEAQNRLFFQVSQNQNVNIQLYFGFENNNMNTLLEKFPDCCPGSAINASFPFYDELKNFIENFELSILLKNKNTKEIMLHLKNKIPLKFLPSYDQNHSPGDDPLTNVYDVNPDGCFTGYRNETDFRFTTNNIPLAIISMNGKYLSLLDYDSATVEIQLLPKAFVYSWTPFFQWNSTDIEFEMNFSGVKQTERRSTLELRSMTDPLMIRGSFDNVKFIN